MRIGILTTVLLLSAWACKPVATTDLHEAVRADDMARARQSLAARPGAVNARDVLGDTPLQVAAQTGNLEAAGWLLSQGADVNARAHAGWTALHWAVFWQNAAMTDLLLRHQATVDAQNSLGLTPLHWAVIRGNKTLVETLLAGHADVNLGDCQMRTPLHYATYWEHVEIVAILIAHQDYLYDCDHCDLHPDGVAIAPLDIAEMKNIPPIVELLRAHGAHRVGYTWFEKPSTTPLPQR